MFAAKLVVFAVVGSLLVASLVSAEAKVEAPSRAAGAMPVLMMRQRQSGSKPDLWLGFLDWQAMSQIRPYLEQYMGQIKPMTESMTQQLMENIPGLESSYQQFNEMADQATGQMNPQEWINNVQGMLGGQRQPSRVTGEQVAAAAAARRA